MNLFCLIKYHAMHVEPTFQLTQLYVYSIYLTTHAQNVLCFLTSSEKYIVQRLIQDVQ